jgi:hypothetical protein
MTMTANKHMDLSQRIVIEKMNHINSYTRKALGRRSPYETFQFLHGSDVLKKLGAIPILPDEIMLRLSLLKK